jgi:hypothetical protein
MKRDAVEEAISCGVLEEDTPAIRRHTLADDNLAVCIGCGCDDNHACGEGCYWLRVDYSHGAGVCSECGNHVKRWDATPKKNRDRLFFHIPHPAKALR